MKYKSSFSCAVLNWTVYSHSCKNCVITKSYKFYLVYSLIVSVKVYKHYHVSPFNFTGCRYRTRSFGSLKY